MAIAGRSYPNVPVISRGSLEDADDFIAKVTLVVTSQPSRAQSAVPPVTVLRGTLQDPPVLTTAVPVVVAPPNDRRWYAGNLVQVLANPQAPAVIPVSTPGPLVISSQPPVLPVVPAFITRNTLADPPVLTTAAPVVTAAPSDRRWFNANPVTVVVNTQAPPAVFAAAPVPVVVTGQPPWPKTVQAAVIRGTLADPPVLTTRGPVVVAAAADRRWFAVRPPLTLAGAVPFVPPPPVANRGLLMAAII
jgi:hypothetical protein